MGLDELLDLAGCDGDTTLFNVWQGGGYLQDSYSAEYYLFVYDTLFQTLLGSNWYWKGIKCYIYPFWVDK